MKRIVSIGFLCLINSIILKSQVIEKELLGTWIGETKGRMLWIDPQFNHSIEPMKVDELEFLSENILNYKSGFFYITEKDIEGRYPWIYCGSFSKYKIENDTLMILHPGYNKWMFCRIEKVSKDTLILVTETRKSIFKRASFNAMHKKVDFDRIELDLIEPFYYLSKKITIYSSDSLVVEDIRGLEEKKPKFYYKLPIGYFSYLKTLFIAEDIARAKREYFGPGGGDGRGINIQIIRQKRVVKKIIIRGVLSSDNITRVLIPLIYCEDLMVYPDKNSKYDFVKYK